MGNAYELDGQLFTNTGEFLDALSHEYKHGDKDLAVQTLEDYGFSLSDIHVGDQNPHPSSASDDAHATQETSNTTDDKDKE
ncbi:MAG: hypothetical protein V4678_02055 [Patescibacteria group bacterium]